MVSLFIADARNPPRVHTVDGYCVRNFIVAQQHFLKPPLAVVGVLRKPIWIKCKRRLQLILDAGDRQQKHSFQLEISFFHVLATHNLTCTGIFRRICASVLERNECIRDWINKQIMRGELLSATPDATPVAMLIYDDLGSVCLTTDCMKMHCTCLILCIVRTGQSSKHKVAIALIFFSVMSKTGKHCFIESFHLVPSWALCRNCHEFYSQIPTYGFQNSAHYLCISFRVNWCQDSKSYDPVVKKHAWNIRSWSTTGWDYFTLLGISFCHDPDILIVLRWFRQRPIDVHRKIFQWIRRWQLLLATFL